MEAGSKISGIRCSILVEAISKIVVMLSTSEHGSAKLASVALKQLVCFWQYASIWLFYWPPIRSFASAPRNASGQAR